MWWFSDFGQFPDPWLFNCFIGNFWFHISEISTIIALQKLKIEKVRSLNVFFFMHIYNWIEYKFALLSDGVGNVKVLNIKTERCSLPKKKNQRDEACLENLEKPIAKICTHHSNHCSSWSSSLPKACSNICICRTKCAYCRGLRSTLHLENIFAQNCLFKIV